MVDRSKHERDSDRLDRPLKQHRDPQTFVAGLKEAVRALEQRNRQLEDLCLRQDDCIRDLRDVILALQHQLASK